MTDPGSYTKVPRATLWLVPEGEVAVRSPGAAPGAVRAVAPFYVSRAPITNREYEAHDQGHRRAAVSPGDDDPVVLVSLAQAAGYCRWYAELSRKPFRLPTESEWEHAARAGSRARHPWVGEPELAAAHAWTAENSGGRCRPVGGLRPNAFGLHDVLGLTWEWVTDDAAAVAGADRRDALTAVARGGSFRTPAAELDLDARRLVPSGAPADDIGFRIVRPLRLPA